MPAKVFASVQFTTKTEPTPNDSLVLDKTRYQRNAVVQPLAAQLARKGLPTFWHPGNCGRPFSSRHLPFVIRHPAFVICHFFFPITHSAFRIPAISR